MMRISGMGGFYGNYGISSILSSRNNSNQVAGLLGRQSRVRSTSFDKVLQAYRGQNTAKSRNNTAINRLDPYQRAYNTLSNLRSDAADLKGSVDALTATGKNSLFEKKDMKQSDGTTVKDYDKDAIYSAVDSFVKDYNATLESASGSSDRNVQNAVSSMSRITGYMSRSLEKIGITQGRDGKLSLSEDTFKAANMDAVKNILGSQYGISNSISYSAARIQASADAGMAYGNSGLYGSNGGYNSLYGFGGYYGLGNYFNGFI